MWVLSPQKGHIDKGEMRGEQAVGAWSVWIKRAVLEGLSEVMIPDLSRKSSLKVQAQHRNKDNNNGSCLPQGSITKSCPTLCHRMDCSPWLLSTWYSPGKNTGVGCHALLQEVFLIQGLNPHWQAGSLSGKLICPQRPGIKEIKPVWTNIRELFLTKDTHRPLEFTPPKGK